MLEIDNDKAFYVCEVSNDDAGLEAEHPDLDSELDDENLIGDDEQEATY